MVFQHEKRNENRRVLECLSKHHLQQTMDCPYWAYFDSTIIKRFSIRILRNLLETSWKLGHHLLCLFVNTINSCVLIWILDNAGVIIFWPKHVSSESVNNDAAMFKFSGYLFDHIQCFFSCLRRVYEIWDLFWKFCM